MKAMEDFVRSEKLDLVSFEKNQRKDDVAAGYRARFHGEEGLLFVGKAQEKAAVFRTQRRKNPTTGASYAWLYRSTAMVNQYYFYALDRDFGPFFLKFCSYFPYNAKLCINGHEYVKRQLELRGIDYEALDNGVLSCADPTTLQKICDQLSPSHIDALLRKWLRRLPHPFTAKDRARDIRYELSILQAEFSLTQVLDQPVTGRVFFEEVIRENLDIGRPDQVQLIFDRRIIRKGPHPTPGRFRTRVITEGVYPTLHVVTTRPRGSSSTTKRAAPCGRRPRSTTPATSTSANGCTTFPHSGRSAFKPTDVYSTSNESATTARSENGGFTPFSGLARWTSRELPLCASRPTASRLCCTRSHSSASYPAVSPTPICASGSSLCSPTASARAPSPMTCAACACMA